MGQSSFVPESIVVSAAGLVGSQSGVGRAAMLTVAQVRTLLSVYTTAEVDSLLANYATLSALSSGLAGKQAADDTLNALAGVTTAADTVIYATGADAFATNPLTAFGRSLIDDADAATARTTLGLGTMATQAAASYLALSGGTLTGPLNGTSVTWSGATAARNGTFTAAAVADKNLVLKAIASQTGPFIEFQYSTGLPAGGISYTGASGFTVYADNWLRLSGSLQTTIGVAIRSTQVALSAGMSLGWSTASDPTSNQSQYSMTPSAGLMTFSGAIAVGTTLSLGPYTFATLPAANSNTGKCLRITDRGQKHAYSDGTNWLFVHDNSVVV